MFKNMFLKNTGKLLSNYFVDTDSKINLDKNLQSLPDTWIYRNKKVFYNLNSSNYRTKDFDKIDWTNSIVVFGCSMVFGTGLAEDELLTTCIENQTGISTVNMGANGSSIYFSYYNQLQLIKNKIKPKAVINVWTDIHRLLCFNKNHTYNLGPWAPSSLYLSWNSNKIHSMEFAKIINTSAKIIWNDIPYFECTFFPETSDLFNIQLISSIDKARDMIHPGQKSMANAASIIVEQLNF